MTLGPLMIDIAGLSLTPAEQETLRDPRVGGVILFTRNYHDCDQLAALVAEIHALRSPALLVAVDQEGGRVQRFRDGFTALPPLRWLGRQYDIDEAQARRLAGISGWLMAAELREMGVDFSFAPVLDLDWGLSEIIGDRAIHNDPDVVASLGSAYVAGMKKAGMAAVAKHFPGHGGVIPDSHVELPVDHRSYDEIMDDIRPYETIIEHGIQGIMMAHVRYLEVDRRIASLSPYWMTTELRAKLGFTGAIFSDDLNMSAMEDVGPIPVRASQALEAGADMALICNNPEGIRATLDELPAVGNPVSAGRLAAMRPAPLPWDGERLTDTIEWQAAVAALVDAAETPALELDG